jgi:hypothetical protein
MKKANVLFILFLFFSLCASYAGELRTYKNTGTVDSSEGKQAMTNFANLDIDWDQGRIAGTMTLVSQDNQIVNISHGHVNRNGSFEIQYTSIVPKERFPGWLNLTKDVPAENKLVGKFVRKYILDGKVEITFPNAENLILKFKKLEGAFTGIQQEAEFDNYNGYIHEYHPFYNFEEL